MSITFNGSPLFSQQVQTITHLHTCHRKYFRPFLMKMAYILLTYYANGYLCNKDKMQSLVVNVIVYEYACVCLYARTK